MPRHAHVELTPEQLAEARRMRAEGCSLDRIGSVIGVSVPIVRRHLPGGRMPHRGGTANHRRAALSRHHAQQSHGDAR